MAASDTFESGKLRIRGVFGETVAILGRNLAAVAVVSLLMTGLYELGVAALAAALGVDTARIASPLLAFSSRSPYGGAFGGPPDPNILLVALVVVPALYYVTLQIATVGISFATFRQLAGRPADPLTSLRVAVARLLPAFGIVALVMLSSSIAAAVAWFAFFVLLMAASAAGYGTLVWSLLPLIVVLSVALWAARLLRDWVAVPAFVLEGAGLFESVHRSGVLTRGRRGRIVRLNLLLLILGWLLGLIVGSLIATAVTTAFAAVLVSVVYARLRAEKEGLTTADIARELDRIEQDTGVAAPAPPSRASVVQRSAREGVSISGGRMLRWTLVTAGVLAMLFLGGLGVGLANIDRFGDYGPPPPADYAEQAWDAGHRHGDCFFQRPTRKNPTPIAADWQVAPTGTAGDAIWADAPRDLLVFDAGSPQGPEDHDTLILPGGRPGAVSLERVGAHLRLCDTKRKLAILLARQYCHGGPDAPSWNNAIEEIAFPDARETWLADTLYDALPPSRLFPSVARVRDLYRLGPEAAAAQKAWTLRPFREILPGPWLSSIDCRRDLDKISRQALVETR